MATEETLPDGTVTMLMTDVVGSTRRWEEDPHGTREAIRRHDEIADEVARRYEGYNFKDRGEGDSLFLVFTDAIAAMRAAVALRQENLAAGNRLRAALHTAAIAPTDSDYYGPEVIRCARLRAVTNSGQILLTHATAALLPARHLGEHRLHDWGFHRLKDLIEPERIYELTDGVPGEAPAPSSTDRTTCLRPTPASSAATPTSPASGLCSPATHWSPSRAPAAWAKPDWPFRSALRQCPSLKTASSW